MASNLPPAAAAALRRMLAEKSLDTKVAFKALADAFEAVGWQEPEDDVLPRAQDLSPAQRALFEALAPKDLSLANLARFGAPSVRLGEWIGIAPGGALEKEITVTIAGERRVEPLWRALQLAAAADEVEKLVAKMPLGDRLVAFGEVSAYGYEKPYRLDPEVLFDSNDEKLLGRIRGEGKQWAPRFADHLLTLEDRGLDVCLPTFVALARAKVEIEPRWDALLPIGFSHKLTLECVGAIPAARRDAAIAAAVRFPNVADKGLPLLEQFPSEALTRKLLEVLDDDVRGRSAILKELARIGKKHAVVRATVEEFLGGAPAAPTLTRGPSLKPKSVAELSAAQRKQLEHAGRLWDGKKLSAAVRLGDAKAETSLRGRLEIFQLGDGRYDAFLHSGDSGAIFAAGTTKVVAEIVQGGIECKDAALRAGIEAALAKKSRRRR